MHGLATMRDFTCTNWGSGANLQLLFDFYIPWEVHVATAILIKSLADPLSQLQFKLYAQNIFV